MAAAKHTLTLADLGRRARVARMSRQLTLEEVVARAGLTASWLSKLENGLLAPSLEALVRLAAALECDVGRLVEGVSVPPAFVVDKQARSPQRPPHGRGSMIVEPLANGWHERRMRPTILHVSGAGNRHALEHHDGERFLLVLDGEVRVAYGDEQLHLCRGDSVYLRASIPHGIWPPAGKTARVLSVSCEPTTSLPHDVRRPG
jgi:transcriptional regulator with XRE-family HTH domain